MQYHQEHWVLLEPDLVKLLSHDEQAQTAAAAVTALLEGGPDDNMAYGLILTSDNPSVTACYVIAYLTGMLDTISKEYDIDLLNTWSDTMLEVASHVD